jgi:hypothetical protein
LNSYEQKLLSKLANPAWRLEHLYKITTKNSELVTFKPNAVQKLINSNASRRKRILKARQFGITTNEVLKRFDSCIFSKNKTVCILAHKQDVLEKIFNIVKIAFACMPSALRPKLDRGGGSRYEYRFPEINSSIYTALEIRGGTIHELHISEAAFIPETRINATLQAVPIDGIVTEETTPNGLNHFYDSWNDDDERVSKLFFPWFFHPEYRVKTELIELTDEEKRLVTNAYDRYGVIIDLEQIAFRRMKIREYRNRYDLFIQEYPEDDNTCFLSSGANPFDLNILKQLLAGISEDYRRVDEILISKPFNKNLNYVIGCDPAEGVKKDWSVATVLCVETGEDVAFFRGQVKPSDFADIIYKMGKLYSHGDSWPCVIVERNNHGHAVILKLNETLNYPHLWLDKDERIGHVTSSSSRPLLVDNFIEAIGNGEYKTNFKQIITECLTLIDNNGKIEADTGKNDDSVISAALAFKAKSQIESRLKIYQNINQRILV